MEDSVELGIVDGMILPNIKMDAKQDASSLLK